MPAPMSMDLRQRIIHAVERGPARSARPRGVLRSARRPRSGLMQQVRTAGSAAPAAPRGHRPRVLGSREADLRRRVEATPTSRWPSSRRSCSGAAGCRLASRPSTKALRRIGLRHKKSLRAAEQDRPDVAGKRRLWRSSGTSWLRRGSSFLDETGTATNMAGAMAAALRVGVWLRPCHALRGAPRPSSLGSGTAASSHRWCWTGQCRRRLPRLWAIHRRPRARGPGDVVVLDNLAAHRVDGVRQAIAAASALLTCHPTAPI